MTEINLIYNKGDSVMTREEKLEVIADILEVEEVEEDNVLEDFETWDSIAVLSVISVITEETGLFPHANEIKKIQDSFGYYESNRRLM